MPGKSATVYIQEQSDSRRQGMLRLAILFLVLLIIAGYVSPIKKYYERTQQIESERVATDKLVEEHERLVTEKEELQNNAYVEQVARRDLGLVKPGEQPFVLKDLNRDKGGRGPLVADMPETPLKTTAAAATTDPIMEASNIADRSNRSFLDDFLKCFTDR